MGSYCILKAFLYTISRWMYLTYRLNMYSNKEGEFYWDQVCVHRCFQKLSRFWSYFWAFNGLRKAFLAKGPFCTKVSSVGQTFHPINNQHLECTITSSGTVFWVHWVSWSSISSLMAKLILLALWICISSRIIFWTLSWHSCSISAPKRINRPPFMAWLWFWKREAKLIFRTAKKNP